jgi:DNA-directed RNA polymerase specialized sigma24 family protein
MASDAPSSAREILLVHLESLYTLARLLTPRSTIATELVVAAAASAAPVPADVSTAAEGKVWALRLLLATHRADPASEALAWPDAPRRRSVERQPPDPAVDQPLQSHREDLARQTVTDRLPAVFATLRTSERVLLFLADMEGLAPDAIAQVTGQTESAAAEQVQRARAAVLQGLRADLRPSEQALVRAYVPEGGLREALQAHMQSLGAPLPGGLRHSVVSATSAPGQAPQKAREEDPPAATGERASSPSSVPTGRGSRLLTRALVAIVLVALVGTAGYITAQWIDRGPETNLIMLSAEHAAERPSPNLATSRLDEAERYVQDELNLRPILPSIDQATLEGVTLAELAANVTVPAFFYEQADGTPVMLYALSYRLLDRYSGRIQLDLDVLRQIEDDTHYDLHDLGHAQVLVWRHRDVIFIAVTDGDAATLRDRIVMPS